MTDHPPTTGSRPATYPEMDDNGRKFRIVPNPGPGGGPYIRDYESQATPDRAGKKRRCADVPFVEHHLNHPPWYMAEVGDHVWDWKMGEGHVIDRLASCATDQRYCDDWGYEPHQHQDVKMCECGRLYRADHHWALMPKGVTHD